MKKILILSMSCQQPLFMHEIEVIKDTWAKDLPSHIDFMYYDGLWKNTKLKDDHLMISSEDDLDRTFLKTIIAFKYLSNNGIFDKYDYVFRTNTSTYVNVKLLSELCNSSILNNDTVYGSDIYSLVEAGCPMPLDLYPRGNGILYTTEQAKEIAKNSTFLMYFDKTDDVGLGAIVNLMYNRRIDCIKGLPHGWFKCLGGNGKSRYTNHTLCESYDKGWDPKLFANFVTIQIRAYVDRSQEENHYRELDKLIKENTYKPEFSLIKDYINKPPIFIGSILGYLSYDEWKNTDKEALANFQMTHKASDDISRERFLNFVNNLKDND